MAPQRCRHIEAQVPREQLIAYFHHGGLYTPHLREGLSGFKARKPSTDDDRFFYAVFDNALLYRSGAFQAIDVQDSGQIETGNCKRLGAFSGGHDKVVIRKDFLLAIGKTLYENFFFPAIDLECPGISQEGDV